MRTAFAALLATCLLSGTAHAGRSFFGWLQGTEVMPERGVELQVWTIEENDRYTTPASPDDQYTAMWIAPVIGITDRLELLLPNEFEWGAVEGTDGTAHFTWKRFGAGARYRFVPQDEVEAPPLVPLVQVSVKRDVQVRNLTRVEGGGSLSYEAGRVVALAEVGYVGEFGHHTVKTADGPFLVKNHNEIRPAIGVSVSVTDELRLGGEIYSEVTFDRFTKTWAAIGPNVSWTHGRFWLSGAFGIGVYQVSTAPRVMWGIAF
ncbi:MAG TPA: hypothetical protein VFP84_21410 [Kofleriaceae bacterium]|nr:hypothetical protein [Kofleriaceae bacterium]